jgi:hypothetical protein
MLFGPWRELRVPCVEDLEVKNGDLGLENTDFWNIFPEILIR